MLKTIKILLTLSLITSSISMFSEITASKITSFNDLITYAKEQSYKSYKEEVSTLPKSIKDMSYSQYNLMRYNTNDDLWANKNYQFTACFFPLGTPLYSVPVEIFELTGNESKKVAFDKNNLQVEPQVSFIKKDMPDNAGYAGFKLRLHPKDGSYPNEFCVFQGSSYFRVVSNGSSYGLSNRGIAIDTGLENQTEEFPKFTKFWLVTPKSDNDSSIVVYAYLDGKSITGAFQFTITPGTTATIQVKSVLLLREKVNLLGISPITSMYWFDISRINNFHDYRPSVHNSDGLIIGQDEKDTTFLPLVNYPSHKMINYDTICSETPKYFGLIQRVRNYNLYMDPSVKYHLNPNCVITPNNDWGKGKIRLFILPTVNEWMDNVNTFWVPDTVAEVHQEMKFDYTLTYSLDEKNLNKPYVLFTNNGLDINDTQNTIFSLSYKDVNNVLKNNLNQIEVKLDVPKGVKVISKPTFEYVPYNNTYRVLFTLTTNKKAKYDDKPFPINAELTLNNIVISEKWQYLWYDVN